MPHVEFSEDFPWRPLGTPQVVEAYKAGCRYLVTTPCALAAIAAGKAQKVPAPRTRKVVEDEHGPALPEQTDGDAPQ